MQRLETKEATQEQVRRYHLEIWRIHFSSGFEYRTFDMKLAWGHAIDRYWRTSSFFSPDWWDPLGQALRWFWENILRPPLEALFSGVKWAFEQAIAGVQWVLSGISSVLNQVWSAVQGLGAWIWSQVSAGLGWLWSVISGAIDAVKGALSWVWSETKAGLEWVYKGLAAMMSGIAEFIISGLKGIFETFKQIGAWIVEGIKTLIVDPIVALLRKAYEAIIAVGQSIYNMIFASPPVGSPIVIEGTMGRVLSILAGVFGAWGITEIGIHAVNVVHPLKNLELRQTRDQVMHWAGFHAMLTAFQATWMSVTVEQPLRYEMNAIFTPTVPGPTDLVRFELREVWRPEFRPELLTPPPTDRFLQLMRYQGYDRSFAEDFWAAHWELPSPAQGYEMFQRLRPGLPGISKPFTEDDLRALLRRLDILPAYHDQLIDIAYRPYSRVDVRRMYKAGVLDREGVKDAYLDLGYSPERAELMTEWTVRWTEEGVEREAGAGAVKALIKEGFRTKDEGRTLLAELGYGGEDIEKQIRIAELMFEYDYKSDLRSLILDRFTKGEISDVEATARLSEVMPAVERVEALIARYRLRVRPPKAS